MPTQRVTVQLFHPFPRRSQANRVLRDAIAGCPGIEVRDLYELYPDFGIDVAAEQEVLLRSDAVVFQHPLYWYSCPALMKEWLDAVLELGFAFGPGGTRLEGKAWLQAITTGAPADAYGAEGFNRYRLPELLRPFEQTAAFCRMRPLEPFVVPAARQLDEAALREAAARYRALLERLRDGDGDGEGR